MALFQISFFPLVVGLTLIYAIPHPYTSSNPFYIPLIVGLFGLILLIAGLFNMGGGLKPVENAKMSRWVYFVAGYVVLVAGVFVSLLAVYSYAILGLSSITPMVSSIGGISSCTASALLLYMSSRSNSTAHPNLMRKFIIISVTLVGSYFAAIVPLVLIYAVPVTPPVSYPLSAAIGSLASVPFILLILLVRKDFYLESEKTL